MTGYESVAEGARALLVETVRCVSETGHRFAVVGGWSPVLLNSSEMPHPGTSDVDLLFEDGYIEYALRDVCESLLCHGFYPSAKHGFQLLKPLSVQGRDLIYNVDILYPSQSEPTKSTTLDMFVDHLEMEIPLNAYNDQRFRMKSIVAPHSDFIFKQNRIENVTVEALISDGTRKEISVPVIDELALLVTKSKSVLQPKRPRDAFDIYLAVKYARDYNQLVESTTELEAKASGAYLSLASIRGAFENRSFDRRVNDYVPSDRRVDDDEIQRGSYSAVVREFLDSSGLP